MQKRVQKHFVLLNIQTSQDVGMRDQLGRTLMAFREYLLALTKNPTRIKSAVVAEWLGYRIVAGLVTSSSPVPLKTRRVGQQSTLNLSRAQTFFRWCGVVVRRESASLDVVLVTWPWSKITWSVAKSPRVAEQCNVNIH
ncbi:uncharacterized protein TNCV_4835491 [Trichonephila clavipes]|nr:uncharacterized protein TNCV_4835491 [Trichonephila clavipes]